MLSPVCKNNYLYYKDQQFKMIILNDISFAFIFMQMQVVITVSLHILRDSGTPVSALALFFEVWSSRGQTLGLSFGLAGRAAGGKYILPATGTGQNQLVAQLS